MLCLLLAEVLMPAAAQEAEEFPGIENVMVQRPLEKLDLGEGAFTLTFQDNKRNAPSYAVDLSLAGRSLRPRR